MQNKTDIQFFIKLTLAEKIWGKEARYKVQILRDRQLLESLGYMTQSEDLFAQAYHH